MINTEEKDTSNKVEWRRVLIREEFLKLYFDNLGLNESFKVERLTDLPDILRKKDQEKFLFAIARINKSIRSFRNLEHQKETIDYINKNKLVIMVRILLTLVAS